MLKSIGVQPICLALSRRSWTRSTTKTSDAPWRVAEYAAISPTGPPPKTATDSPGLKPYNTSVSPLARFKKKITHGKLNAMPTLFGGNQQDNPVFSVVGYCTYSREDVGQQRKVSLMLFPGWELQCIEICVWYPNIFLVLHIELLSIKMDRRILTACPPLYGPIETYLRGKSANYYFIAW